MLRLVFLESSLELIPSKIVKHPAIQKDAKRRKKKPNGMILDDSKHHSAMKELEKREKRGRPDIVHQCLLLALDSKIEDLEIYVHTIGDKIIWINRKTRLPRNYNRFIGLMEDLFKKKEIKADEVLLKLTDLSLDDVLEGFRVVVMCEKGERNHDKLRELLQEDVAVCIGAFPHGDFEDSTLNVLNKHKAEFVSIADKPVTALYVTCKVLSLYELYNNIA